ncbi:MAG: hypothetical protein MHM6MM_001069 [Cercozoa sp. M6MM]
MLPHRVDALKIANVGAVNLANNHILDYRYEGALETLSVLDQAGIKHCGVGRTLSEARAVSVVERNGVRIGFLGATDHPEGWEARAGTPVGCAMIDTDARPKECAAWLVTRIQEVRSTVDILVVCLHWGPNWHEDRHFIDNVMMPVSQMLVDAGADVIHGTSSHHVLPIRVMQSKSDSARSGLVVLGQGDLLDDYDQHPRNFDSRTGAALRNDIGVLVKAHFSRSDDDSQWKFERFETFPTRIEAADHVELLK